jgi:hypothetical protein
VRPVRVPLAALFFAAAYSGCSCTSSEPPAPVCHPPDFFTCGLFGQNCPCPTACPTPSGPTFGVRSDGRVDVNAKQAWPSREAASPPFTPDEIAHACTALAACSDQSADPSLSFSEADSRAFLQHECLIGGALLLNLAERVVPFSAFESWRFLVQSTLDANGDCTRIRTLLPKNETAFFVCQEDGCYAEQPVSVRCKGDIATVDVTTTDETTGNPTSVRVVRDCTRSDTQCLDSSPTGCTDRQLTRCSGGTDRCDGDIKLGCDSCGYVSYHDCSWDGGHCLETTDGASCVSPGDWSTCENMPTGCQGTTLSVCAAGQRNDIDCKSVGMGCARSSLDASVAWGLMRSPTLAYCAPSPPDVGTPHQPRADGGPRNPIDASSDASPRDASRADSSSLDADVADGRTRDADAAEDK